tara:strand:+ start:518 stop:724 length:207 start_codon:yes stop_codon:yes gene_type:complete
MPKFRVMIEDLTQYSCEVEAENIDEAQEKFHEELEENAFDYYKTCLVFDNTRDYDGYLEEEWYDDDED